MKLKDKIVNWIKKQVKESKAKGLVMGLSGGIDSSLVAWLCREAVGENFLCLILPCYTEKEDLIDAKFLAKKFNLKTKIIDLTSIYEILKKSLPRGNKISLANLKPRLRMLTLYYFANNLNYLVVGTGNKSELMTGYFTKYGDGAVDILPIGNLYKTEVRKLAKELEIPEKIIKKIPSAGLWKGQSDEKELGISYEDLDSILEVLERKDKTRNSRGIPPETPKSNKVKKLIINSQHKREMPKIFKN